MHTLYTSTCPKATWANISPRKVWDISISETCESLKFRWNFVNDRVQSSTSRPGVVLPRFQRISSHPHRTFQGDIWHHLSSWHFWHVQVLLAPAGLSYKAKLGGLSYVVPIDTPATKDTVVRQSVSVNLTSLTRADVNRRPRWWPEEITRSILRSGVLEFWYGIWPLEKNPTPESATKKWANFREFFSENSRLMILRSSTLWLMENYLWRQIHYGAYRSSWPSRDGEFSPKFLRNFAEFYSVQRWEMQRDLLFPQSLTLSTN